MQVKEVVIMIDRWVMKVILDFLNKAKSTYKLCKAKDHWWYGHIE